MPSQFYRSRMFLQDIVGKYFQFKMCHTDQFIPQKTDWCNKIKRCFIKVLVQGCVHLCNQFIVSFFFFFPIKNVLCIFHVICILFYCTLTVEKDMKAIFFFFYFTKTCNFNKHVQNCYIHCTYCVINSSSQNFIEIRQVLMKNSFGSPCFLHRYLRVVGQHCKVLQRTLNISALTGHIWGLRLNTFFF